MVGKIFSCIPMYRRIYDLNTCIVGCDSEHQIDKLKFRKEN